MLFFKSSVAVIVLRSQSYVTLYVPAHIYLQIPFCFIKYCERGKLGPSHSGAAPGTYPVLCAYS